MIIENEQTEVKPQPATPPVVPTTAASLPTGGRIPDGPDLDWDAMFAAAKWVDATEARGILRDARRCG